MTAETFTGGATWDVILSTVQQRRSDRSPLLERMAIVRDRYNADYVIIDPTNQSDDAASALTPTIIDEAIDQPALRAASVLPAIYVPAVNPTLDTGKGSREYAEIRRRAYAATWDENRMKLMLRKGFRQLRAYSSLAFVVEPNFATGKVDVSMRDPLTALPEPKAAEDVTLPRNAAFIYSKSAVAIRDLFPRAKAEHGGPIPIQSDANELWDLVEWIDDDCIVYGLLGPRFVDQARSRHQLPAGQADPCIELARFRNPAGCCTVVVPQAVTLDTAITQIGKIIGHMDLAAQLMLMEIQAAKSSIWPDRYIIGNGMGEPRIVGGNWKDGSTGSVNLLENVQNVGELRGTPDPTALQLIERLERNARVTVGSPQQYGGETGGYGRTGRAIDTLGAWAVDPRVQEMQEIMELALEQVNVAIAKTYKGAFGSRKFTMLSGREYVQFTPSRHFEDVGSKVSYAIAGADKQGTTVTLGQQLGMKLISHRTAREKHPDIDDPEGERQQIIEESLDEALMVSILQRSAAPDVPGAIVPEDAAKIRRKIREGKTLDQAVLEVNEERQRMQAQQAEAMAQGPGQEMMPPEMMQPGMAGPNEGASPGLGLAGGPGVMGPTENPGFGIEGPSNDLDRFRMLSNALRSPGRG